MSEELKENLKAAKLEDDTLDVVSGGADAFYVTIRCTRCGCSVSGDRGTAVNCPKCGTYYEIGR